MCYNLDVNEKSRLIRKVLDMGYQVDPGVLNSLCSTRSFDEVLSILIGIIKNKKSIGDKNMYIVDNDVNYLFSREDFKTLKASVLEDHSKIIFDASSSITTSHEFGNYSMYLRSRFDRLNALLKEHLDWKDIIPINLLGRNIKKGHDKNKISGFVFDKRIAKKSSYLILEDSTNLIKIMVPPSLINRLREILLDQYVIVEVMFRENITQAVSINPLDISSEKRHRSVEDVNVIVISNLLVGSPQFDLKGWDNFVSWLNGDFGELNIVSRIKYMIINGDLIDPSFSQQLSIADKYKMLYELVGKIPSNIRIFLIPGECDATRTALPQPAVIRSFARHLYSLKNVVMLGNPSTILLDGVFVLMYHGQSLDDVKQQIETGGKERRVTDMMESLLKARHLAPSLGMNTSIAPDQDDNLVIQQVPDLFICSHLGESDVNYYKGTMLLSCPSWTSTGIGLEKSRAAVVSLKTFDVIWRG
jgi:DNA polymerase II small subunit